MASQDLASEPASDAGTMQGCDPPAQAADLTSAPTSPRSSLQERAFVESIEPDEGRPHGTAILEKLQQILEKYGTVGTYLVQRHAEPGEAKDFLARLHDLGREDLPFHALQATLPSTPASAGPQARDIAFLWVRFHTHWSAAASQMLTTTW